MTNTYKVLSQTAPSATTLTDSYTVPSSTSTVVSTIAVCNRGTNTNYRIAIRESGASIDPKHYIVYDQYIASNDSIFLTLGISIRATDVISVYAGTNAVSFSIFGTELS